jgi:hypothetical protein
MTASTIRLNDIYDRTTGRCHLCGKRLAFHNYGCHGTRGAWHIEHSVPRANGGTDHVNNLYPGCTIYALCARMAWQKTRTVEQGAARGSADPECSARNAGWLTPRSFFLGAQRRNLGRPCRRVRRRSHQPHVMPSFEPVRTSRPRTVGHRECYHRWAGSRQIL